MTKNLSIITICYNNKDEIARTCESIIKQTWQDFEWLVIDGGSTDGTLDILQKYRHRINILISEPDTGIYNAMNKGIKLAHGERLNFMNGGDNFASDDALERVFKDKTYTSDILYGNMNFIRPEKSIRVNQFPIKLSKNFFYHSCISHQASFIKKDLFEKYGLYDESYRIVADWEKWLLFLQSGCKFQHIDVTVTDFYSGGISSKMSEKHLQERKKVFQKYYVQTDCTYYLFNLIPIFKTHTIE